MTNQEYIAKLNPEELYLVIDWLMHDYGRNYTDTRCAVIEWLKKEYALSPEEEVEDDAAN